MIPKIIHFCWFGGNPLPPLALECIASWRKYLPEYEIWQWSEGPLDENENLKADRIMTFDVNSIPYTAEAYKQRKYAFVSDYCRFVAMYEYGGIYFDTDVEVIKPMDDIIAKGNFMGFEVDPDGENTPGRYIPRYCFAVNPGVGFGFSSKHPFVKDMLMVYDALSFDGLKSFKVFKTIVAYTTESLYERGLKNIRGIQLIDDINVYPREYFAPINVITGRLNITKNTRTIHRYTGTWDDRHGKSWKGWVRNRIPEWMLLLFNRIKRTMYKL